MAGTNSFVNGDVMGQMAERISNAKLVEIADSGHVVPVENPAGIVAAALPFLS